MHIGFITGEYPPMQGGVGDYTRALAHTLAAGGDTVSILTDRRGTDADLSLTIAPEIRAWNGLSLSQVNDWARRTQPDVISLQFETAAYHMSPWVHLLPYALRPIPVVTTFHDLKAPYLFPKAGRMRTWWLTRLAKASAGVIVTNPQDAAELTRHGITRIGEFPIGANIQAEPPPDYDRAAWRAAHGIAPETFVIGYFGFMNESKGVDIAIQSLGLMRDRTIPACLVLIGGRAGASDPANAAYADQIDRLIGELRLTDSVVMTGFIDSQMVSAYLLACDAVALPFRDGVSTRRGSFMAALAHGCAIVTTPPAIAQPALTNAIHIAAPEPEAFAVALGDLYADPAKRAELSRRAGQLAERYTWPIIAGQIRAFLGEFIQP